MQSCPEKAMSSEPHKIKHNHASVEGPAQKKIRNLRKKLAQIEELQGRPTLNADQLKKLASLSMSRRQSPQRRRRRRRQSPTSQPARSSQHGSPDALNPPG